MAAFKFEDEKLNLILEKLVPEFQPTRIFLFGSRSKGSAHENSDYDLLLLVQKSDLSRHERMSKALTALWGCGVKVDVFIYTEDEFNEWKNDFSSIPHTVMTEGLELKVG
jgi:predicted nucleotidyltransferase